MKKIIILIPIYNDWQSLKKLLDEINSSIIEIKNTLFKCYIINDCSTTSLPNLNKPHNFLSIKILNIKKNQGHARCNALGIKYIVKKEDFDHLILMDGDGEDRPIEVIGLVKKALDNPNNSVVAKRVKRSEGIFFQFLYQIHKLITLIFTGKNINFGNFSCLTKKDAILLSSKASLWSSYSGTLKKNLKNFLEVDSIRGVRYFGPSKMSILKLVLHSFSIIAVFKFQVFFRSFIFFLILMLLNNNLGLFSSSMQLILLLFCIVIFAVSIRESKNELEKSEENVEDEKDIIQ